MNGRCWTSQVPDAITFELNRIGDVMSDQFEPGMTDPLGDIGLASGEVIIKADNLLPGLHQTINQVRADKASPSSHQIDQRPIPIYWGKLPRKSWFSSLTET